MTRQEIKPTYATFEQSKWLKDKGFDIPTLYCYLEDGTIQYSSGDEFDSESYNHNSWDNYSMAEQWQVVEWLFLNHHLWVSVDNLIDNKFYFSIRYTNTSNYASRTGCNEDGYNSPQEAYSAAFDFIKQNSLI